MAPRGLILHPLCVSFPNSHEAVMYGSIHTFASPFVDDLDLHHRSIEFTSIQCSDDIPCGVRLCYRWSLPEPVWSQFLYDINDDSIPEFFRKRFLQVICQCYLHCFCPLTLMPHHLHSFVDSEKKSEVVSHCFPNSAPTEIINYRLPFYNGVHNSDFLRRPYRASCHHAVVVKAKVASPFLWVSRHGASLLF